MKTSILLLTLSVFLHAATINVPIDYLTIQDAIDAANHNDVIVIANNEYVENLTINNKSITLLGQDSSQTIINGSGSTTLTIVGDNVTIDNLSFTNAADGISVYGTALIQNCRFTFCVDGIDYESGGGECLYNYFSDNADDAIDLDGSLDIHISNNIIIDNNDDGIEIRLHHYTGDLLTYRIENNYSPVQKVCNIAIKNMARKGFISLKF